MRRGARAWERGRAGCLATLAAVLHAAGAGALVTVGDLRLPGQARSLAVADGIAWVVTLDPRVDPNQPLPCPCPQASLRAIRVSDPEHPEELGVLDGLGDPRTVEVAGGIAYVVESAGLLLIDVSDPTHPVELSRVTSVGRAYDVAVAGPYAYVAGWTGLTVVDVSDPRAPLAVGALELPASLVEVRDGFAYVAGDLGSHGRLEVVDVADPASPKPVGGIDTPRPTALALLEGHAWIVEDASLILLERSLLHGFDVSDPANPVEVGSFEEESRVLDVEANGVHAHLAGSAGMRVVDVSDAASPVGGGALATPGDAVDLEVVAGLAYVVAGFSLQVIDLSEADVPAVLGSVELPLTIIHDVEADGDIVYLAANSISSSGNFIFGGFLGVIDAADPAAPRVVGRASVPGLADEVEVAGGRAWVTGAFSGTRVFDVSDPTAPREIASLDAPDARFGSDLEILGDRVHLAWPGVIRPPPLVLGFPFPFGGGLRVIDPARSSRGKGASTDLAATATGLEVVGDLAYLADAGVGLRVIDASRPTALEERGSVELAGARDVEVELGVAYLTSNSPVNRIPPLESALHAVDVADPSAPRPIGVLDLPAGVGELEVVDGLAYLVTSSRPSLSDRGQIATLRVVDVSDPAYPGELGALGLPNGGSLEVARGLVYVAGGSFLRILDLGPEYRGRASAVAIDVKPGDARNAIDPRGRGSVRVAVLGSAGFDVRAVEPRSLAFGPAGALALGRVAFRDVDRDGDADLVARFLKRHTGLAPGATEACLRGRLLDGARFEGCDAVQTPPPR